VPCPADELSLSDETGSFSFKRSWENEAAAVLSLLLQLSCVRGTIAHNTSPPEPLVNGEGPPEMRVILTEDELRVVELFGADGIALRL
jgi:hypothetical protein